MTGSDRPVDPPEETSCYDSVPGNPPYSRVHPPTEMLPDTPGLTNTSSMEAHGAIFRRSLFPIGKGCRAASPRPQVERSGVRVQVGAGAVRYERT